MYSSSSEENDSEAMFPNEQQQAQDLPSSGLAQSSELSPPYSQDPPGSDTLGFGNDDIMDTSTGPAPGPSATAEQIPIGNLLSNGNTQKSEPGWAWKNKKARDEYSRAMEMVVDKSFTLSEYFDVTLLAGLKVTRCIEQYGDPFTENAGP